VSRVEESLIRRRSGRRILAIGLGIGVLGVLPLLLYIQFGPRDGNPIGLGLLAAAAVPVSGIVMAVGLIKLLVERLSRPRA
jgi:hypothetical protein